MHGKREYPKRRSRVVGVLALFAATAVLLPAITSQGVESPAEEPLPAGQVTQAPVQPDGDGQTAVMKALVPAAPAEAADPAPEDAAPESAAPTGPAEPVGETARADDSYFAGAAFLGDSRTDGFRLYSGLKEGTYFVSTGATVESVFTKAVKTDAGEMPLLDAMAVMEPEPERIYVMLGVNELGWVDSNDYYTQYGLVIDRLRQDHPDAEVILQTNMPVTRAQEAKKTYVCNSRIAVYNDIIRTLAGEKNCPLVDTASAVADEEGFLRTEWSSDGVHLNTKGCKVWLEYLRTHAVNWTPPEEDAVDSPTVADAASGDSAASPADAAAGGSETAEAPAAAAAAEQDGSGSGVTGGA